MRRLPVYFLVDVSESMVGEPIKQVESGMRTIIQELRTDPYALETVYVSVIAFAGKAKSLSPLTELFKFYPPVFPVGGGTSLGKALDFLMDDIEQSVVKTTVEQKGDWKPIVFLFTDGNPTDDTTAAINRWNSKFKRRANIIAISIGDNVNTQLLGQVSDNVLRLTETDETSFKQFFKWVTDSIKTTSVSVSSQGVDEVKLAPTSGINLEKVDGTAPCKVDENFVVLLGKCPNTMKPYLVKYAKRLSKSEMVDDFNVLEFKLVGAYQIDEEQYNSLSDGKSNRNINTNNLVGAPTCPCCGNQWAMVICGECGQISCADNSGRCKCAWCGSEGSLGDIGSSGVDITRGRG
ncbi:MAG: VWA domain-containing protein [Salinivirgaceae bacterium]|nr:VWA domain-containing protein [Salinivirgaceae bacterium]